MWGGFTWLTYGSPARMGVEQRSQFTANGPEIGVLDEILREVMSDALPAIIVIAYPISPGVPSFGYEASCSIAAFFSRPQECVRMSAPVLSSFNAEEVARAMWEVFDPL